MKNLPERDVSRVLGIDFHFRASTGLMTSDAAMLSSFLAVFYRSQRSRCIGMRRLLPPTRISLISKLAS
jgi:hypothetical protein